MEILANAKAQRSKKTNKIEELKSTKRPKDVFERLEDISNSGYKALSEDDKSFFLKCFGIFDKGEDEFMLRVRVPAGHLSHIQAKKIGEVAQKYGNDYIDITTRAQIELRYIKTKDLYIVLKELQSVSITTFQTGIDNFRNIITSAFDDISYDSQIECKTIINDLQSIFLDKDEWIGTLPRKFNTAILGTMTNDCNIYGHDCSFALAKRDEEIGFLVYLGGKVGVQAQNTNIFVTKDEVIIVYKAIIELFREFGFRDNRNKNRLHFLIEAVGIDEFVKAIDKKVGYELKKYATNLVFKRYIINDGIYNLKDNKSAIYISIASGIFSGSDMIAVSNIAEKSEGFIRLSVEQSLFIIAKDSYIDDIKKSNIYNKYVQNNTPYLLHQVACAGTKTCKFGVIENKQDAIELAKYLQQELPKCEGKIRFFWSACPKGCGIHAVADIGFEGCKAKDSDGNSVEGVHIYIGGKATKEAKEARVLYKSIPLNEAKYIVKNIVSYYINNMLVDETFEEFDDRVFSTKSIEDIIKMIE